MALSLQLTQTLPLSIEFDDTTGAAIQPAPAPDTAPVWTVSDTTIATLMPAADGLSAALVAVAVGTVTVSLTLVVTGTAFSASLSVPVVSAAVSVASIKIVPGTPTATTP